MILRPWNILLLLVFVGTGCRDTIRPADPVFGGTYRYEARSSTGASYRWEGIVIFTEEPIDSGSYRVSHEVQRIGGPDHLPEASRGQFDFAVSENLSGIPVRVTFRFPTGAHHEGQISRGRIDGTWSLSGTSGTFTAVQQP